MDKKLGRLKSVKLRDFFEHEAREFTPWLAEENNISLLSEALGMEIEIEDTEFPIGKFNADIVGNDISSNRKVLIENQLTRTDHDHLGKIITYSAGFNAEIMIWISEKIRDEHRKAITYLNDMSNDDYAFFGIEMELWQIGNSDVAPNFNIIVSPNNWSKSLNSSSSYSSKKKSTTQMLQGAFWEKYVEFLSENDIIPKHRTPGPQHWFTLHKVIPNAYISLTIHTIKKRIGAELYIRAGSKKNKTKELYHYLYEYKDEIERELGSDIEWMELPDRNASRIVKYHNADIKNESNWNAYFEWLSINSEKMIEVFSRLYEQKL